MSTQYRRRVGSVRPSHLMFTNGVGSLVDLPNFSVLVRGLDDWDFSGVEGQDGWNPIVEPRLLTAVQKILGPAISEIKPAPWLDGIDTDPNGPASRTGVPIMPFPAWLRCTVCNELAPIDSQVFGFNNSNPRRPHDARFFHDNCGRKKHGKRPLAVAARFVLACTAGHLDDFPYREFIHRGDKCSQASHPRLQMEDHGGNLGANVTIRCISCGESANLRSAMGAKGEETLPRCRGRHPHLSAFDPQGCASRLAPKVLVIGASNQWFAQTLSALYVPSVINELDSIVEKNWTAISELPKSMYQYARSNVPVFREMEQWSDDDIHDAVERIRVLREKEDSGEDTNGYPDLRTAEWEAFAASRLPEPHVDFTLRRDPHGVPDVLRDYYADVIQAERLREVRTLIGFTRLDAPDPDDPELVTRAPLSRDKPTWVPGSEVRGEGVFLRIPEELLGRWEHRVANSHALRQHREAYAQFRQNRYSDRLAESFDSMKNWPGARYIALHTLSHLLIRTIALESGYSAASLSERIYAGTEEEPRSGILIYTAVPDAEGTLGGLVSQAEPDRLIRLTRRALRDAYRCSSDPLCSERLPQPPADFLHGAACHVCLFVSETACERGNRFLDRRFVVPIDQHELALFPEVP